MLYNFDINTCIVTTVKKYKAVNPRQKFKIYHCSTNLSLFVLIDPIL